MKKKLTSILLSCMLCLGVGANVALAADSTTVEIKPGDTSVTIPIEGASKDDEYYFNGVGVNGSLDHFFDAKVDQDGNITVDLPSGLQDGDKVAIKIDGKTYEFTVGGNTGGGETPGGGDGGTGGGGTDGGTGGGGDGGNTGGGTGGDNTDNVTPPPTTPPVIDNTNKNDKTDKSETTVNKDGSTTTTTTNKDGSTTTTTEKTDGTVTETTTRTETAADGTVTETKKETETKTDGTKTESEVKTETRVDGTAIKTETKTETATDGTKTETKSEMTTTAEGVTTGTETRQVTDTTGSVGTVETTLKEDGTKTVEASATVSDKAVEEAKKNNAPVKLPVEVSTTTQKQDAVVIDIQMPETEETVKVEVPVDNASTGTVVVIVHEDGTEEIVKKTAATENGVQIEVSGNVTIKIVDNAKDFEDVGENYWGKDAVDFVSSRELFGGMTETEYAPEEDMSRAMLFTVLARLDGAESNGNNDGAWYEGSMSWAKEHGISDGTDPNGSITREQLATMLYRYAGEPAVSGGNGTSGFTDSGEVSDWAAAAMQWAVERGIINGMDGALNPQGNATRGQVAAMLMRFVNSLS